MNLGITSYWGNRGGGVLAKDWVDILKDKYNVFFYALPDPGMKIKNLPDYATHHKEMEMNEWIKENKINKLVVHQFVFPYNILKELKKLKVELILVPMIDNLYSDMINALNFYDKIVCPVNITYQILKKMFFVHNPKIMNVDMCPPIDDFLGEFIEESSKINILIDAGWGGTTGRKNLEYLLISWLAVDRKDMTLTLKTQNKIDNIENYSDMVQQLIQAKNIGIITKNMGREELIKFRKNYQVLLTGTGYGGLEIVPQEAMALGQPVVAMDWPPVNEFINETNGFIYPRFSDYKKENTYARRAIPNMYAVTELLKRLDMKEIKRKSLVCKSDITRRRTNFVEKFKKVI